jgi:hypothetical protein
MILYGVIYNILDIFFEIYIIWTKYKILLFDLILFVSRIEVHNT